MPQFIYRIQPARVAMLTDGPTPDEARLVGEHFAYLQDLTARGVVLLAGRTLNRDAGTFGIAVYEAADEAAARALMEADPAIRGGTFRAELFPFHVALWSPSGPAQSSGTEQAGGHGDA